MLWLSAFLVRANWKLANGELMHIEDKATNDLPVKTKGDSYSKFVWILALGGVVEEGRAVMRREGPFGTSCCGMRPSCNV